MKNYISDITEIPNDISNDINIKEIYGTIYLYVNIINFKKYIGQTTLKKFNGFRCYFKKRSLELTYGYNYHSHFIKSLQKYGIENFKGIIIDYVDFENKEKWILKQELTFKEGLWIHFFNSLNRNFGYNLMIPGIGGQHSDETKERMSKIIEERWKNPEYQEKMAKATKKRFEDPNEGKKISNGIIKAYENNPELRKRASEISTKRYEDSIKREEMSIAVRKTYNNNPELIKKISNAVKRAYIENPELRKKQSESHKGIIPWNKGKKLSEINKYFCIKCNHIHFFESKIGNKHIEYKKENYY